MKTRPLLFVLFGILPLTALVAEAQAGSVREVKLLTVGNSFAQDSTAYLKDFAAAAGRKLLLRGANLAGHSLEQHVKRLQAYEANPADGEGRGYTNPLTRKSKDWSLREALESEKWDFVTIQQASPKSFLPETYEPFAGILVAYIKKYAPTAEILIHETWAYREDHALFSKGDGFTQMGMYEKLRSAYEDLARRYGLRVIPVGAAFQRARARERWTFAGPDKAFDYQAPVADTIPRQSGSLNVGWLWRKNSQTGQVEFVLDAIHANRDGRYLGAAVFFEEIFQESVVGSSFVPPGMDPADARLLREIAHEVVQARAGGAAPSAKPSEAL